MTEQFWVGLITLPVALLALAIVYYAWAKAINAVGKRNKAAEPFILTEKHIGDPVAFHNGHPFLTSRGRHRAKIASLIAAAKSVYGVAGVFGVFVFVPGVKIDDGLQKALREQNTKAIVEYYNDKNQITKEEQP